MRVFLSDVIFDREQDGKKKRVAIPFGRQDCTVFRKVIRELVKLPTETEWVEFKENNADPRAEPSRKAMPSRTKR